MLRLRLHEQVGQNVDDTIVPRLFAYRKAKQRSQKSQSHAAHL